VTEPAKKTRNTESGATTVAQDSMTAFSVMPETALRAWFGMGLEALQFVSSRMQKDIATQKAMLACRSLEDIRKVQADFYNQAVEDYRAQVSRVMEIMSVPGIEGPKIVFPSTKRSYDDVPL